MKHLLNGRWSSPSTILFATELPVNEDVFNFALAQAKQTRARLIIFHASERIPAPPILTSGLGELNNVAAAERELQCLTILTHRAFGAGVRCESIVQQGPPSRLVVECANERSVERIILGSNRPGRLGKAQPGSVAEEVLRSSVVPVCIIGPEAMNESRAIRGRGRVLCATSLDENCAASATLAAEIAWQNDTELLMLLVLKVHENAGMLALRGLEEIEEELLSLIPSNLRRKLTIEALIVPGDPVEEILFQANTGRVGLLVVGSPEDSVLSTLTRHGVVYRVLAHAPCPVLALSPGTLRAAGDSALPKPSPADIAAN